MKPANVARLLSEIVPVNFNKETENKKPGSFERAISFEKKNSAAKENFTTAPYYDELHFANYE